MFDVLGIGVATVDEIVRVPSFPAPDTKVRITARERACGGLCATALLAAARLGARAAFAGVLGPDEGSDFILRCLDDAGVDTGRVARRPEAGPARSIVIVDEEHGSRTVLSDSRPAAAGGADWPPESVLRGSRVLLVDHVRPGASLRAALVARAAGIPVVADLERDDDPLFAALLAAVDHLVISRAFAERLTGLADPRQAADALRAADRTVVVTAGAAGAWYTGAEAADPVVTCPAFDVPVVDTTGCGDVFHGAYAAALAFGLGLDRRIRIASAAAALKATRAGGHGALPDRAAILALAGEPAESPRPAGH